LVRRLAFGILLLSLVGCTTGSPSPTADGSAGASVADLAAASADLDHLVEALERTHPDPWHGIPRAEFVAALDDLKGKLGDLTPDETAVELAGVTALLSREGRDGHQFAIPAAGHEEPILPMSVYEFAEGLFVTAALPSNEEIVGQRIVAIDGHAIADVLAALEPLVPRDGPATVPAFRPAFLLSTWAMRGLGLIGPGEVELTVADAGGVERTASLTPMPFDDYFSTFGGDATTQLPDRADTLYLSSDEIISSRLLPDGHTLYIRYTQVRDLSAAVGAIRDKAQDPAVKRVVLDLRQNGGGDNHSYPALLRVLEDFADAHPGRLVVLTDRVTFSAAANFATEVEHGTDATFIGEAMGGGLNFWDDVIFISLPHLALPMRVGVSTRYWQKSDPDDPRLTIEPDIAVPVRAADYFAGLDPALEAALAVGNP
jgi:hypothetical protein